MSANLNTEKLAQMIRSKRGSIGLRITAKEIGNVSASTLSRIEQGNLPDIETYILLCKWLNVPTDYFVVSREHEEEKAPEEQIVAHLRADKILDPKTAEALIQMITVAYQTVNPSKRT